MAERVVVLLSGGLDSTCLAADVKAMGAKVYCLGVHYGQRHSRELQAARDVASFLDLPLHIVDLSNLRAVLGGSSQTDTAVDVPEGHYAADNMRVTVVPNRNMILLSVATAHAISLGAEAVAYAAHAGDHAQYPDCRKEFIDALRGAIELCDYSPPKLRAPYASLTKAEIVARGQVVGAPFHLTWSCYKGGEHHCGRCGTCVERVEAFGLASVPDPTQYLDVDFAYNVLRQKASV